VPSLLEPARPATGPRKVRGKVRSVRSRRRWRGRSSARICRGRTAGRCARSSFSATSLVRKGRSRQETCGADAADAAFGRRPRDRDGQRHAIAIVTSCAPLVSNTSTGASSSSFPCATQPCSGSSAPATIRRCSALRSQCASRGPIPDLARSTYCRPAPPRDPAQDAESRARSV
jgi:hypothetical protein